MGRVMKKVPLVVLCVLIIAVPSVWADWVTNGAAICSAAGDQHFPAIVSDGAGGAILTWRDCRNGIYSTDIYAQRVNASGAVQWTTDAVALCTATGIRTHPAIVSDGAGGAIVTWLVQPTRNARLYAQRVDASGAVLWTTNGVPLCTATGVRSDPAIASDGAGGAIVTWMDARRASHHDIYAQRVNASGAIQWTTDGVALCTAAKSQMHPVIVPDSAGGAIVTWYDNRSGSDYDIYAQRVSASGAIQWTADGVPLCTATGDQEYPAIISDGADGVIVTWEDNRSGNLDIYAQRVNASGAIQWTVDGVALCTAPENQCLPGIVSDAAGGVIVTWYDNRSRGLLDIYAQRVNALGAVQWTTDGVALSTATSARWYPKIISDGAGGAIVTWLAQRTGNAHLYAQRVDASGAVLWTTNGVALATATGLHYWPTITSDGAGGAIVAWDDKRTGTNSKIYALRIGPNGSCTLNRN